MVSHDFKYDLVKMLNDQRLGGLCSLALICLIFANSGFINFNFLALYGMHYGLDDFSDLSSVRFQYRLTRRRANVNITRRRVVVQICTIGDYGCSDL